MTSDPAVWDALIALEQLNNQRVRDEVGNIALVPPEDRVSGPGASYVMAAFTHINPEGSRFSDGCYGVYYAAAALKTAIRETVFHFEGLARDSADPPRAEDFRVLVGAVGAASKMSARCPPHGGKAFSRPISTPHRRPMRRRSGQPRKRRGLSECPRSRRPVHRRFPPAGRWHSASGAALEIPMEWRARAVADFADPGGLLADAAVEAAHLRRGAAAASFRPDFVSGASLDHAGTLAAALAQAAPSPLVAALHAARSELFWHYGYQARLGEVDLSDRIACAELIGPDATLFAPGCRIGFTLMAAHTFYPMHVHPAIELYRVITGAAKWQALQWGRILPAGATILHPTNLPHAMRSFAEPLLAHYGWRGDLDTRSHYL